MRATAFVIAVIALVTAPALENGQYALTVGLFDDARGYRWPLDSGRRDSSRREYEIVPAIVTGASVTSSIAFRGRRGPVSVSGDRQIVARRGAHGPASIVMVDPKAELLRAAIAVSGAAPVVVTSTCGSTFSRALSNGNHVLDLTACRGGEIHIAPADARYRWRAWPGAGRGWNHRGEANDTVTFAIVQ